MPIYDAALLAGAVIAGVLSWNLPRASLWIILGALSFYTSYQWHLAGWPYPAVFGASTNLAVCFAIYAKAQLKYEMRVWNCFHLMVVIDLLYLSGWIKSRYDYAVGLELANWLGLLIISMAGLADRAGYGPTWLFSLRGRSGWVSGIFARLWETRDNPPFWHARE